MKKPRSHFEIFAEILREAKNGVKKTRIVNSCGLPYGLTMKYLALLLNTGLLRIGDSYHTTEKGLRFLTTYQTLDLLLNTKI